mgnify:CR=1 FL=1
MVYAPCEWRSHNAGRGRGQRVEGVEELPSPLIQHFEGTCLDVADLVKPGRLILNPPHPHDGFQGGDLNALVEDTAHAGNDSPLATAGGEHVERLEVFFPEIDRLRLPVALVEGNSEQAGVLVELVRATLAGARPVPAKVFQFFSTCWARLLCTSSQPLTSAGRT